MPAPAPIPHAAVDQVRQLRGQLAERDREIGRLRRDLEHKDQQLAAAERAQAVARRITWGGGRRETSGP